jgi:hypothetical protein
MAKTLTFMTYRHGFNYIIWYSNKIPPQLTHNSTYNMSFYIRQDKASTSYHNHQHNNISKLEFNELLKKWQGS